MTRAVHQEEQGQPRDCIQGVPCQTCKRTSNPDNHSAEAEKTSAELAA